jgi:hypothetical protein
LKSAIENTAKLFDEDRYECLELLDEKLIKRTLTYEMAFSVAIDPRQDFGRYEPNIMEKMEKGLQERLERVYDLKVRNLAMLLLLLFFVDFACDYCSL